MDWTTSVAGRVSGLSDNEFQRRYRAALLPLLMLILMLIGVLGCEQPMTFTPPSGSSSADAQAEDAQTRFREDADPQAIRWLLANCVGSGMTRDQVNAVLGLTGQRVFDDTWLKADNSGVQRTDETYRWGPDNEGQTYYLFFRDNRLVAFDPAEYE